MTTRAVYCMTVSPGELSDAGSVVVDPGPVDDGGDLGYVVRHVLPERGEVEDGFLPVTRDLRVVYLDRGVRFSQKQLV